MSRVGKAPIAIPQGVEVAVKQDAISVKGALGAMSLSLNPLVSVAQAEGKLSFAAVNDSREASALCGTMRQLVNNMVTGVTKASW